MMIIINIIILHLMIQIIIFYLNIIINRLLLV